MVSCKRWGREGWTTAGADARCHLYAMQNPDVARLFDEVADLLEIKDENPFRVRAYRNAARTIRDFQKTEMVIAPAIKTEGKSYQIEQA